MSSTPLGQNGTTPSRDVRPRTRPGRLSPLDAWLLEHERPLLDGRGALVDVGYGETPITTLEWARSARSLNPSATVIGLERRAATHDELDLREGDFGTCASLGPAAVVRAMNVLRGYREEEVPAIHAALGAGLVDGGLLIEGSTDTEGHVTVAWLLRKRGGGLVKEALLFHTDFTRGFSPWLFRDWLPRDLRRRAQPGTEVHALLTRWDAQATASGVKAPQQRFAASVPGVLDATPWELERGYARSGAVSAPPAP